jgi:hypothetical protein
MRVGERVAARLAVLCLILGWWGVIVSEAAPKYRPKPGEDWTTYKNERFGYSLYYPAGLFIAGQPPENGSGMTFTSKDGRAKVVVFGVNNGDKLSPREYRRVLLQEFGGYDKLDYSPVGQTWFVLSGFRGENIYYQKVMFSCAGSIINVLSVTFPTAEKPFYESLVELIEDNFKTGRGADTPSGC